MTLVEIAEPLFQYIAKINRLGKAGGTLSQRQVRDEVKSILAEIRGKADKEGLGGQFDKIELPLIFFADHMVRESRLAASWGSQGGWKNIAEERREMAGDERFWDLLEETLLESGDGPNQRLACFYTMVGMGFTGIHVMQPDLLRRKMREIAARVRGLVESDTAAKITPDAYENVDTRSLTQPPARRLIGMVIVLVGMVLTLAVSYVMVFKARTGELTDVLTKIREEAQK